MVAYGIYQLAKTSKKNPESKPLLALMGAFIFVVSALKLPSVFGSSSHPTGSGLAATVFGPAIASVLSMIALIFQATLLSHGGITTLGANVFSMGIIGPAIGFITWMICRKARIPTLAGVFLAVALSDISTYVTTSVQLALAFPTTGFVQAFLQFATIFAVTQIPLAITEGILAVFIFEFLLKYKGQILSALKVIRSPIAGASERQFQLKKKHYAILIAVLLTLFITPLIFISTDMAGTDDLAEEIISMTGYQPWFDPVLTLPEEFETPLFALQALIGASIITYFVLRTRRRDSSRPGKRKPRHSQDEGHSNLSGHIDSYAHTNSLAKNSPTTKILFALSMLVLSVLSPSPVVPLTMFIVAVVLLIGVAQIPGRFILDLLTYPLAFAGVSCVFIALFFGYGATLAQVTFPWFTWTVYGNGITLAVATFFRVLGAISAMFLLVLTTSMTDLFISLRKAHMPKVLIEISLLVYRYIFVFMEVAARMTTAQKLRLGQTSWLRRIRSTSLIAVNLFIRTMEQGERTFVAMNARGYDGNIRLLDDQPKPSRLAIAGIVVFNILFALVALNIIQIWSL